MSRYLEQARDIDGRITYCEQGDASTGEIKTTPYQAGMRRVTVMMAGYPDTNGIQVLAVATDGSFALPLKTQNIGDKWKPIILELPAAAQEHAFYLRLVDGATGAFGWAGIGIEQTDLSSLATHALAMALAVFTAHLWLVLTGCLLPKALNPSTRSLWTILALGTVSGCVIAGYIVSPILGKVVAHSAFALPLLALALRVRREGRTLIFQQGAELHRLFLPSLILALLILWIGLYPFYWDGKDWPIPANRWRNLPMDSWLPLTFANMVHGGRLDVPMIGDWLSSDRPPLQSGLYLYFHSLLPRSGLIYQGLSTWAQTLIIVPLLVLTRDLPKRSQRTVVILTLVLSPLVLLNGLFVWPKLLAATFCAIFHLALFGSSSIVRPTRWLMAGLAAVLAMLSHGGALFALVGSATAFLLLHRRQGVPILLKSGALALAAYVPWVVYQRFIDPPGDRLLKWHFAGHVPVTQDSFMHVLRAAYADLSFDQWFAGRIANLNTLFQGSLTFFGDAFTLFWNHGPAAIATIIHNSFFHGAYSLWFASPLWLLPCAVYALVRRRNPPSARFPFDLLLATCLSFLFWIVAIYEPGQTIIHQGAYFNFLVSMLLVLVMLARYLPPVLYAVAALNVSVAGFAYAFDITFAGRFTNAIYMVTTLALAAALLVACHLACRETVETDTA
ncbi:hypothetical protein [Xanthomonas translucens]|nr:hypothetical protein [Xanthomonas translucens]